MSRHSTSSDVLPSRPRKNRPLRQSSQFISRLAAAELLCVDVQTIDALVRRAQLSAYRVGRRVILRRDELLAWLESQRVGARRVQ
jgi:excisionase family DNA binding protein